MAENENPDGYLIPLHKSLTEPILMAGVPRNFFIMNLSIGIGVSVAIKFYPFLLVSFVLYSCMVFLTKKDPQIFEAIKRHINQKKYFDA